MADPLTALGAAASVAQFASLAAMLTKRLHDYHSASSKQPQILQQLQDLLPLLSTTCEAARERCDGDGKNGTGFDETLSKFITQSLQRLKKLDDLTLSLTPAEDDSRVKRTAKAFRSISKEKALASLQRDLERDNNLISNYLSVRGSQRPIRSKLIRVFPSATPGVKRTAITRTMVDILSDETPRHPKVIVLHGLGGQGKTSLALDFCRSESEKFEVILWMDAASKQCLQLSFAAGLRALSSRRQSVYDLDASAEEINTALENRTWLMVFDNYDDPRETGGIVPYFPRNGRGTVIVTSRHGEAKNLGAAIDVGGMEEAEAVDLLLSRTRHTVEDTRMLEQARDIVALLGYLPLAIDQASAYIAERNLALDSFKKHYADRKDRIFQQIPALWNYSRALPRTSALKEVPLSVMTTWELSFEQLDVSDATRDQLTKFLSISALIAGSCITEDVFIAHQSTISTRGSSDHWLDPFCVDDDWDSYSYQDYLATLANHSLIHDVGIERDLSTFVIHPIVKQWLQLRIPNTERRSYIREASELLVASAEAQSSSSGSEPCERLVSYQDALLKNSTPLLSKNSPFGAHDLREPSIRFATLYASRARWDKAAALLKDILHADQKELGEGHRDLVHVKCQLAEMYTHGGKYADAKSLLKPLLENEAEHTPTGRFKAAVGMAAVCAKTDQLHESARLYEKAIDISRDQTFPEEIDEVHIMDQLARVYRFLAQHDKAQAIYSKTLDAAGSRMSVSTLRAKVGLADLLRNKADYRAAKELYVQAAGGLSELLGPEHPETIGAQCNLAIAHRNLSQWRAAEEAFWYAITNLERVLGKSHVDTLRAKMNLALVYDQVGQKSKARLLYVHVLEGREKALGLKHSHTLRTVERLTTMMILMDDHVEAEKLALRTLKAGGKVTELEIINWIGKPHELRAMERLCEHALERDESKLGAGHVDVKEAKASLAMVKEKRRRHEDEFQVDVFFEVEADSPQSFHSAVDTPWSELAAAPASKGLLVE